MVRIARSFLSACIIPLLHEYMIARRRHIALYLICIYRSEGQRGPSIILILNVN